jgi:heptosyltransferase-3
MAGSDSCQLACAAVLSSPVCHSDGAGGAERYLTLLSPRLVRGTGHAQAGGRAGVGSANRLLRGFDAALGPALLRLIGRLRRRRAAPLQPRRIGVMKTTGIGDMVLASAVARDMQDAFPEASLVLFAGPGNAKVAELVENVTVVTLPTARPWRAIPLLRATQVDILLDLGQWTRLEALYAGLSRARWTVGFRTPGFDRHFAYDESVLHSDRVSELENFRAVARAAGATPHARPYFPHRNVVYEPPAAGPYVVFHLWPGGFRSELREWPAASWRELIDRVRAAGYRVVLSGGPDDIERTRQFVHSLATSPRSPAAIRLRSSSACWLAPGASSASTPG